MLFSRRVLLAAPALLVPNGTKAQIHLTGAGGKSAGGGTVSSTWSTADAAINGYTLSNANMSASGVAQWWGQRGTTSKSSGKQYVEFKATGSSPSTSDIVGLANAAFSIVSGNYMGNSGQSIGFDFTSSTYASGGFVVGQAATAVTPAVGDVIALAVDLDAGRLWVAHNNVWRGGGNPAVGTETLPNATFSVGTTGPLFFGMSIAASDTWTLQSTGASQTYTPPSGFTPWG